MSLHDDFCERTRFRNARCTCGGDDGESYSQIVRDTLAGFAADMRRIMKQGRGVAPMTHIQRLEAKFPSPSNWPPHSEDVEP